MPGICKKHQVTLTLSFDPSNSFCLMCEKEPKGEPTKNEDGFRLTAAPAGVNDVQYYSVIEDSDWGGKPKYTYLFKTQEAAKKELDLRSAADLNTTFYVALVTTKIKCTQWHKTGMSIPTYAVWQDKSFPVNPNGNHAKMVQKVNGLSTARKTTQAKLKPKYGGSLNKGMVTPLPTPTSSPKSTGPAPIPMPTSVPAPAPKKKTSVAPTPAAKKPTSSPLKKRLLPVQPLELKRQLEKQKPEKAI